MARKSKKEAVVVEGSEQQGLMIKLGELRKVVAFLSPILSEQGLDQSYANLNFGRVAPDDLNVIAFARNEFMRVALPVSFPQELDGISINGNSFCSYVRSLKQSDEYDVGIILECDVVEGSPAIEKFALSAGKSECSFAGVAPSKFNVEPVKKFKTCSSIGSFVESLRVSRLTTAKGRAAGIFGGVHIDEKGDIFSTDRYRISQLSPDVSIPGPITIPSDFVDYLVRQYAKKEVELLYAVTESTLVLQIEGTMILCSLMSGKYPSVNKIVEQSIASEGAEVELDEGFKDALEQHTKMQSLIPDATERETNIKIADGQIALVSRTPGAELKTKIPYSGGGSIYFAINPDAVPTSIKKFWVAADASMVRFVENNYTYMVKCK